MDNLNSLLNIEEARRLEETRENITSIIENANPTNEDKSRIVLDSINLIIASTEKIEELLAEKFPDAKIARMDYDTVKGKNDHDTLIKLFEQQRIDVLVGTQMVVKGLDFEHVNLVGIIDADGILNFTDFRVNERAFQLMEQVSGRAGRKDGKGKVLVQVNNVYHPVLQFVKLHDYKQLYHYEIESRKAYNYPPFFRIITLIFKHKEKHIAEEAASIMMQGLKTNFPNYLNGPAQPMVDRIRNKYIWEILIKLPKDTNLINQCKKEIMQQIIIIQSNKLYRSVTILPDAEPISILKKDKTIEDVVEASDQLNLKALSKPVTKYFICFPKVLVKN